MTGDEQTNTENDSRAAQTEQVNSASPPPQTAASHEHRNQWILFGVLAVILLGTVVVIALLRPLIFGRIVPAVMGDTATPETAVMDEAYPTAEDAAPTGENELFIPVTSGGDAVPAEEATVEGVTVEETAVSSEPAPEPVTHTVQAGDNLTKIAAQYGVSVEEIMVANNLTNADYISVGQVLIIPTN